MCVNLLLLNPGWPGHNQRYAVTSVPYIPLLSPCTPIGLMALQVNFTFRPISPIITGKDKNGIVGHTQALEGGSYLADHMINVHHKIPIGPDGGFSFKLISWHPWRMRTG